MIQSCFKSWRQGWRAAKRGITHQEAERLAAKSESAIEFMRGWLEAKA